MEPQCQEGAHGEELRSMLERNQSLLLYYNNIASLQDWYSTENGSHTPLQDDGDELVMDLVTGATNPM